MEILSYALSSVTWLLEYIYINLVLMLASSGFAIIGVGFISYLIMYPIHRLGLKIERQINVRIQAVNNDLSKLDHSLKGEKRFEKKEEIFNKHGYTPFQNIGLAMGFIFLLPLLLSAISFFTTTDLVVEKAFFSIPDLGKMDGLLFGINFLPILMLSIGVLTAVYQWSREAISPVRPIIISLVVFIIVYELPSAMLIFWLSVNGAMLFVHSIRRWLIPSQNELKAK